MELSQLAYFMDAAKTQHLTRSAQRLHIAQPALTKSIHRLEEELGVPLFRPRGRNIVLTEYGERLRQRLEPILASLAQIPEELHEMAGIEQQTLHVNVSAASTIVTEAIILYQKTHPDIRFQILQNEDEQRCDLSVTTAVFQKQVKKEAKESHFVLRERIFLAVPRAHALAERGDISLREAKNENFIMIDPMHSLREICDSYCEQAGFSPRILFESSIPATVRNLIEAGIGVGFWPEFTWGRLGSEGVTLVGVTSPACVRDLVIECREAEKPAAQEFFLFLSDYCICARAKSSGED